ncbi:MAG: caspase family protein [Candidatus Marinimicrobia bacterium]|jgi:hypothetical protein|nr:caspase family protein [Candidatus Neomarinimicrobiota bacterium]
MEYSFYKKIIFSVFFLNILFSVPVTLKVKVDCDFENKSTSTTYEFINPKKTSYVWGENYQVEMKSVYSLRQVDGVYLYDGDQRVHNFGNWLLFNQGKRSLRLPRMEQDNVSNCYRICVQKGGNYYFSDPFTIADQSYYDIIAAENRQIEKNRALRLKKILDVAEERNPELFLPKDEFESTDEYSQRLQQQKEFIEKVEQELIAEQKAKRIEAERLAAERAAEEERLLQIMISESLQPVDLLIKKIGSYDADQEVYNMITIDDQSGYIEEYGFVSQKSGYHSKGSLIASYSYEVFDSWPITSSSQVLGKVKPGNKYEILGTHRETIFDKYYIWYKIYFVNRGGNVMFEIPNVEIPRNEARSLKENYSSAKVEGYKQLQRDLRAYEYFNMVVIHPITGSRFPFGPMKDLAAAPVIAGKKSVVPPDLTMRVAFVEPNGNGFLDAEEKGKVKVSITNSGNGSAMGVFVKLNAETSNQDISAETSKIIGEVPSGQTKTTEFEINVSKSVTRMENRFTVSATESYGFPPDPAQISFETFPFIPPKLELVDFGISTAIGDNIIRPGVLTTVQSRVQNRGQGSAEGTTFSINLPWGVRFSPESRTEFTFLTLKPGEFKDLEFSFYPNKKVGKTIEILIGFTEESINGNFPLKLEVEKPQQTIQQLVVKGQEMGTVEFSDVATISVDIEKDIPSSAMRDKDAYGIIFGIENYKKVPGVSFARRDAEWAKVYFEKVLGIPSKRIYYKTNSDVSKAEFDVVFSAEWLKRRVKSGKTNLYVYYAGHGAPELANQKAYLIPFDGHPDYPGASGLEVGQLYERLGAVEAKSVTVFLDACFSGANRENEMLLADARPVLLEVDKAAAGKVTVFSAASGKEISSAWPEKKHGLFSYFLMKGMRGEADINDDKQLTLKELNTYLEENVSETADMFDRKQTPQLQTLDENRVLVRY